VPNHTNPTISDVRLTARYEALRELANQLAGLLVSRQRSADSPSAEQAWRTEHRTLREQLAAIQPGTPEVGEALDRWAARLRALREDATA